MRLFVGIMSGLREILVSHVTSLYELEIVIFMDAYNVHLMHDVCMRLISIFYIINCAFNNAQKEIMFEIQKKKIFLLNFKNSYSFNDLY